MVEKEIKKIKDKLSENLKLNQVLTDDNTKKARLIELNNLDNKLSRISCFSLMSYFVLMLVSIGLTSVFGVGIIAKFISPFIFPLIITGSSLIMGTIVESIINNKINVKGKLGKISNSKTQAEMLEEEMRYKIETEKLSNYNEIIKHNYKRLTQDIKYPDEFSYEEANRNLQKSLLKLEDAKKELNILTAKSVLAEKFMNFRDRRTKVMSTLFFSEIGGVMLMLLYNVSFVILSSALPKVPVNQATIYSLIQVLAPALSGMFISGIYLTKRSKAYTKVLNSFNNELKENARSLNYDIEYVFELEDINSLIQEKQQEIGYIMYDLEIQKLLISQYEERLEETTTNEYLYDKSLNDKEKGAWLKAQEIKMEVDEYFNNITTNYEYKLPAEEKKLLIKKQYKLK